jgi:hypothetical protein
LNVDRRRWTALEPFVNHMFLDIEIRYNSHGREFRSVRHFQSDLFVLVDDDGHAFDIWEYAGDGEWSRHGRKSLALRATRKGAPTYRRSIGVRRALHTTGTKGPRN